MTPLPHSGIACGRRVAVWSPADEHCDHDILWGVGVVTFVDPDPKGRVEVMFDNGSGGMFPRRLVCDPENL